MAKLRIIPQKMCIMDNIKEYLKNLYKNYLVETREFVWPSYKSKCLGSMEALLVVLGVLGAGQPFQFQTIEDTFFLFWVIPIKYNRTEGYEEHILRLVYETLNKD